METYKIVRYYAPHIKKANKTIKTGLTLEEAKKYCSDSSTQKTNVYFDGFVKEGR